MADWEGWMSQSSSFQNGKPKKDEDFDEDDAWEVDKERHDSSSNIWRSYKSSGSSSAWRHHSDPRTIPNVNAATSHEVKLVRGSSAPQDIPDWSKIYGAKNTTKGSSSHVYWDGASTNAEAEDSCCHGTNTGSDEDDDMVPPHQWIARKLARSQISSFSVCEGVGRTLKGRDLSKVRNAVLTKTGFIE